MKAKKIILAGGSGFLGQRLKLHFLMQGHEVIILTRTPATAAEPKYHEVYWDGHGPGAWQQELDGADVLINLTGQNVNCRYHTAAQKMILESRLAPIQILGHTLRQFNNPPQLWIQAAGISIYGDTGDRVCDEEATTQQTRNQGLPHEDFLPDICVKWEAAFNQEVVPSVRKALLRISSILAPEAGALKILAPITRWGLGGYVLPGTQYMSWIHIDDFIATVDWLILNSGARGTYNVTAPSPVTNREFMQTLRATLGRPWSPPVPKFALKLGCRIMQTEPVLALASIRAVPHCLEAAGFAFQFPELPETLHNLYPQKGPQT